MKRQNSEGRLWDHAELYNPNKFNMARLNAPKPQGYHKMKEMLAIKASQFLKRDYSQGRSVNVKKFDEDAFSVDEFHKKLKGFQT